MWTRARARQEGVSLARLTGGVEFVRVVRGVYLEAVWADDLGARCAAVLSVVPGGCASHWTALELHGLPVPASAHETLHVLVGPGRAVPDHPGVVGHRAASVRTYPVEGVPATGPVRSWCDSAALDGDLGDLVAAGDALWRRRPSTLRDIGVVLAQRPGGRGTRRAREALALLDRRAESAMESRLRVVLTVAGLAPPAVNHDVHDPRTGRHLARVDLAWPDRCVAVEYDGEHHRSRAQWVRDLRRREGLERAGWVVVVVVVDDLLGNPDDVVARVAARLAVGSRLR